MENTQNISPEEIKARYIALCANLKHGCSTKAEVAVHNRAMKQLGKLYHQICGIPDKSFMLDLLLDSQGAVPVIVASHCLGMKIYVPEAEQGLEKVGKTDPNRFLALEACATLFVWRQQGYLEF